MSLERIIDDIHEHSGESVHIDEILMIHIKACVGSGNINLILVIQILYISYSPVFIHNNVRVNILLLKVNMNIYIMVVFKMTN